MTGRVVYVDGAFVPGEDATVSIFDRGVLFADAVYEGLGVLDGQIVDFRHHMARLTRSLGEVGIAAPMSTDDLWRTLMGLIRRNDIDEGFIYLQISRGVAERDYVPPPDLEPTVFAFTQPVDHRGADAPPVPLRVHTAPDLRWARRDIKTTNLLGQVMAKSAAAAAGSDEALMIDGDGYVTEAGARSFFIVVGGTIVARPLAGELLPGVTRRSVLAVADERSMAVDERRYRLDEVLAADEAFVTGASSYVEPVIAVDDHLIGDGAPGPITLRVRTAYLEYARTSFYRPDPT